MEHTMQNNSYRLGIDIGSTTVKTVLLGPDNAIRFKQYERHNAQVRDKIHEMLENVGKIVNPDEEIFVSIAGSAGLSVAELTGIPFVQEVYAERIAVDALLDDIDAVIELGGEDAKILFLTNGIEERMNGSCAGGTGAFIDQMASLLNLSITELDEQSFQRRQIYSIASRCGVFAKSDIQPLLNQGADKADIAASIYQSIVNQTISGLAQGREIDGRVAFLGGPLTFLYGLRERFTDTLKLDAEHAVFPENAEYYVAIGAAMESAEQEPVSFSELNRKFDRSRLIKNSVEALPPLFADQEDYDAFKQRHTESALESADIRSYQGAAYLGIDAGSTTTKLVLISEDLRILYTYYASNHGEPLPIIKSKLEELLGLCEDRIVIKAAAVTGYGEELIKNAFGVDFGVVETVAHYFAARHFKPDVDFIIDIGGQDMKCFKLKNGVVDSILLNEACSSGCGSFIEAFASALGYSVSDFAKLSLFAKHPVNLGSRCTVFMNSSVKQAQKDGAGIDDISAGLSISVIKNAMYKVIRARNADDLGKNIVVQGGTFLNDAVLRAFETELGRNVTRPVIAGLMGAFGAALYAKQNAGEKSTLLNAEGLAAFTHSSRQTECGICTNHCRLIVNTFNGGQRYISGNRCERPTGKAKNTSLPNSYQFKLDKLLSFKPVPGRRGKIGIPFGLNMYENLPFWYTCLTELGFEVVTSGVSSKKIYAEGQHTIPSDTVCYPAKLMHGHIEELLNKKLKTIFYPGLPYNFDDGLGDNHYNCPVVAYYPELLAANISRLKDIVFINKCFAPQERKHFTHAIAKYFEEIFSIPRRETAAAVDKAFAAYKEYRDSLQAYGRDALNYANEKQLETIVLCGRPYHVDPEIHHGIPDLISSLGFVVISEDCVPIEGKRQNVNVLNQWTYHSRMYNAAQFATLHKHVNIVQLVSFGCGLDAITTDEIKDILVGGGRIYTQIKIDEINNLGAARIRLRSLAEAIRMQNKER